MEAAANVVLIVIGALLLIAIPFLMAFWDHR
jgi:hypothetical protein